MISHFGVVILGWITVWFGIFALMLRYALRARLRPTNWLVRTKTGGILIKFRSPLNYHLDPNDPVVVHIDYSDIEWFVRPGLSKFMEEMAAYVPVMEPAGSRKDFRHLAEATLREKEDALLELIASGNRMSAMYAVKQLYGYDTTRAVQFIEELSQTKRF